VGSFFSNAVHNKK